ncbi:MAG TPA: hypothetical protein VN222_06905, partial [Novosphingobium sp.]|nr:hypothetical protein [Novosphingobium sp.]
MADGEGGRTDIFGGSGTSGGLAGGVTLNGSGNGMGDALGGHVPEQAQAGVRDLLGRARSWADETQAEFDREAGAGHGQHAPDDTLELQERDRLPWLEAEDEDEDDYAGVDTSRVI